MWQVKQSRDLRSYGTIHPYMPIIESAIKALRQEHNRQAINNRVRTKLKQAVDQVRKSPKPSDSKLSEAYSILDRAAKRNVIHHKKASRLKSRLSKYQKSSSVQTKKLATKK